MSKIDLKSTEWIDIVFEGRNKVYGAYYLRKSSGQRQVIAILSIVAFIVLIGVAILLKNTIADALVDESEVNAELSTELSELKKDEPKKEKKQEIKQEYEEIKYEQKVAVKASMAFTVPDIVDQVDENRKMKNQEELNRSTIAIASVDYKGDENGKGTIDDLKDGQVAGGNQAAPEEDSKVYTVVEQEPAFPGGNDALLAYVSKNIRYPESAKEMDIQGKVVLRFVVLENGSVGDVVVIQALDPACDREAVRVVKSLPRFTPGKQQGKPVKTYFTLPVRFSLM